MNIDKKYLINSDDATSDSSGEIDLQQYTAINRITVYSVYEGVTGGNDGTIKIYISPFDDLSDGKALVNTVTTDSGSNVANCECDVINATALTVRAEFTANSNTASGDSAIRVYVLIEYID